MANTMSDREIEDVLNSVRRLVAQGERRNRLPPLLLTPEMRIDSAAPADDLPASGAVEAAPEPPPDTPQGTSAELPPASEPAPEDATAAEAAPEQAKVAPEPGLPEKFDPQAGSPVPLDDAAVQALVAQIVRDELHGKLGERITLAVRKLVRNEIARALDEERRK